VGLLPRTLTGLAGIPLSPFLHGSFAHLILNTVPLVILGALWPSRYPDLSHRVVLDHPLSGAALWLLGRSAYHVGASSVIFGYFGYLVARGWYERSVTALLVALLTLGLYGGIVWEFCPRGPIFPGRVTCLGARWRAGGAAGNPSRARQAAFQPDGAVSAGVTFCQESGGEQTTGHPVAVRGAPHPSQ